MPPHAQSQELQTSPTKQPTAEATQDATQLSETLTDEELKALEAATASVDAPRRPISARGFDVQYLGATFGWSDLMIAERHTPVFIDLASEQSIVSGTVSIRFRQDASQNAVVTTPFTTRPGATTRVEIPVALPRDCPSVEIIISDGRRTLRVLYEDGNNDAAGPTPQIMKGFVSVLLVDLPQLRDSFVLNSRGTMLSGIAPTEEAAATASRNVQLDRAVPISTKGTNLPTTWMSYEGVSLVAISESAFASADPRAREALRAWLHAGGQVLLFASGAGQEWSRLLTTDALAQGLPLQLDDQHTLSLPALWEKNMTGEGMLSVRDSNGLGTLPVRPITITPTGMQQGWKGLFGNISAASTSGIDDTNKSASTIAAFGPAGLGMLLVTTVDPKVLETRVVPGQRDAFVYKLLLNGPFINAVNDVALGQGQASWGAWAIDRNTRGITEALTAVMKVETLGGGLILSLGSLLVLLVAVVGPMGRWAVRRTVGLSRSWMFAMIAVIFATIVSALLPMLVRSGKSSMGSVCTIDAICDAQGAPKQAWSSSVVGIFAGKQMSMEFSPSERLPSRETLPLMQGVIVRGVSPREYEYEWQQQKPVIGSPLVMGLSTSTLGSLRGHSGAGTSVSQWNLRAFAVNDAGRDTANLPTVRLTLDGAASRKGTSMLALAYSIDGLAPTETLQGIDILTATGWGSSSDAASTGTIAISTTPASVTLLSYGTPLGYYGYGVQPTASTGVEHPWLSRPANTVVPLTNRSASATIGTCMQRAYALDTAVALGGYALVQLQMQTTQYPEARVDIPDEQRTGIRVYRYLIPLSDEAREAVDAVRPWKRQSSGSELNASQSGQSGTSASIQSTSEPVTTEPPQ